MIRLLWQQSGNNKKDNQLRCVIQESSTSAGKFRSRKTECLVQKHNKVINLLVFFPVATEKKDKEEGDSTVAVPAKKPKPAAAKAAAVAKPMRQMMDEDVIPPLKAILESQDDISEIDLSFQDDKVSCFFCLPSNTIRFQSWLAYFHMYLGN